MNRLKIIDLFVGVGGFSLGSYYAGFEPVIGVDCDKILTSSFKKNFPRTQLMISDLSKLSPKTFLSNVSIEKEEICGIIGGPPCQGFSFIGKRDPEDPRNYLIINFFEYVKYLSPSFFLMENVEGILSENFVHYLDEGKSLVENKYKILTIKLNALDYGIPSSRSRIFVIGYIPDLFEEMSEADFILNKEQINRVNVEEAIIDLPSLKEAHKNGTGDYWAKYQHDEVKSLSEYAKWARSKSPKQLSTPEIKEKHDDGWITGFNPTNHTKAVMQRFSKVEPGKTDKISKFPRLKWDNYATTLRAGTGPDKGSYQAVRPIHPEEDRVITIREAARLQGFPDWFQFHKTKWHSFRMIGNSVSPIISEVILKSILESMNKKLWLKND